MNNPFLSLYGQGQAPQSVQNYSLGTYTPSLAQEQAATQANMAAGKQTMAGMGSPLGGGMNPAMSTGTNPFAQGGSWNSTVNSQPAPMVSRPPQQQQQPSYFGTTPSVPQNQYQAQMLGMSQQQPYMQQSPNFAYINMLRQYMMNQQQPQFQQQYRQQYQQPQYQRPFLFGTNMNSPIMRAPWFNNQVRQPLQPGQYGYGSGAF